MAGNTLNKKNLAALGAERLADLCLELATGSADSKRRLRLELSHAAGVDALALDVQKRLAAIRRATGFIEWNKVKAFSRDLDTQLTMITERIAPEAPDIAFDLLWQFVELAPSVYERVDDSNGKIGDIFRDAVTLFEEIGPRTRQTQHALAERIFAALSDNGYGQWDYLLHYMGCALKSEGIATLNSLIDAYEAVPLTQETPMNDHAVYTWGGLSLHSFDRDRPAKRKADDVRRWRQEIADLQGDVDGYLAQFSKEHLEIPAVAAKAGVRLVEAGRAKEALAMLETARDKADKSPIPQVWAETYIAALSALDRREELHAFRWQKFRETLAPSLLRDLLKALPDFEDIEMEERAKDLAFRHTHFEAALTFFLDWADHKMAAELILSRAEELDGDAYFLLTPAAEQLQPKYPLAAVLCRRAMICFTLDLAKSTRYKHAIRHFEECAEADADIESYGEFPDHTVFTNDLKMTHPRKQGFWSGVVTG